MSPLRNGASASQPAPESPVLYAVACGSPAAGYIGQLVSVAQDVGWDVCVVATPDGRKFIDAPAIAAQTGHPVRSQYKNPGDLDVLPGADAMLVAPATVNTVNKWACGIADTLALGMLIEGYGLGVPIAVVPYTNTAMAVHPAFRRSLRRLRAWGVRVLFGEGVVPMPEPGAGTGEAENFPWELAVAAVGPPRRAGRQERIRRPGHGDIGRLGLVGRTRLVRPGGRADPAPPQRPRPAPAILRPLPPAP